MDYVEELKELTDEKFKHAKRYETYRLSYGQAKADLDVILSVNMPKILEKRKNAGYETCLLLLLSELPELRDTYRNMIKNQEACKALEKILDAYDSKIFSLQRVMQYNIGGEYAQSS